MGDNLYLCENNYCVGTWEAPTTQSIPLIYQGEIIKVTNGTFCAKMPRYQTQICYLFIDVKYIKCDTDGNNISGLVLDSQTPGYEFYILSKAYKNSSQPKGRFTWNIQQGELPFKQGSTSVYEIPEQTIIVPINSDYFEHHDRGSMDFSTPDWVGSNHLIKLPNPRFKKNCSSMLDREINQIYCALPMFKVMHSPQEFVTRHAGQVKVEFVR